MTAARRQERDLDEPMTADEFFAMPDDASGTKYQLINGYLVAMAPVAPIHSLLHAELTFLIGSHLKTSKSLRWLGTKTGIQPVIRHKTNVRSPDLGVSCTPLTLDDKTMRDPILLVEILSPSNEKETEANVWMYATMACVKEVLLVHTKAARIELFKRRPNGQLTEALIADVGQSVRLESIDMDLAVDDLYGATPLAGRRFPLAGRVVRKLKRSKSTYDR
jgi:Uma2 family endonuclease